MASVQRKGDGWYCQFCYRGERPTFALGKVSEEEANAKAAQVGYLLLRLKQRLIELPPGVGIVDFVRYDGKPPASLVNPGSAAATAKTGTLAVLRDRFLATHASAHEADTLGTARTHFKHMAATLGDHFPLAELTLPDLQRHVERRAAQGIAPVTIRKEIDGLRAAWNWGKRSGLVAREWPGKGLVYRKTKEKPPFQTRTEIKRRIARGGLTDEQKTELWESLYLAAAELSRFLEHVSAAARHAFIYPMICTAAHTGARRSELLRAQVADVDFEGGVITLREKKRVRGRQTTRRVPLSTFLAGVLRQWIADHPGSQHLFCLAGEIARSKTLSRTTGHLNGKNRPTSLKARLENVRERDRPGILPLTKDQAADHFARTLRQSEWAVMPGWHTLRHSFASICASRSIDQRLINAWMGHQTEEQQKRYQHLFPQQQRQAIDSAFD
jgi:integrase